MYKLKKPIASAAAILMLGTAIFSTHNAFARAAGPGEWSVESRTYGGVVYTVTDRTGCGEGIMGEFPDQGSFTKRTFVLKRC